MPSKSFDHYLKFGWSTIGQFLAWNVYHCWPPHFPSIEIIHKQYLYYTYTDMAIGPTHNKLNNGCFSTIGDISYFSNFLIFSFSYFPSRHKDGRRRPGAGTRQPGLPGRLTHCSQTHGKNQRRELCRTRYNQSNSQISSLNIRN